MCNMPVQADAIFYCRLTLETDITTVSGSSIFCHILLSRHIRFMLEQYLSGTLPENKMGKCTQWDTTGLNTGPTFVYNIYK